MLGNGPTLDGTLYIVQIQTFRVAIAFIRARKLCHGEQVYVPEHHRVVNSNMTLSTTRGELDSHLHSVRRIRRYVGLPRPYGQSTIPIGTLTVRRHPRRYTSSLSQEYRVEVVQQEIEQASLANESNAETKEPARSDSLPASLVSL